MAAGNDSGTRARVLLAAASVALVLLLLLALRGGGGGAIPGSTHVSEPDGQRVAQPRPDRASLDGAPRLRPLAHEGGEAKPPIIDSITLEKQRICVGEENLVTIKAHTPGNVDDAFLSISLDGQRGNQIAIVGYASDRDPDHDEPRTVIVKGRNGTVTTAKLPPFEVANCVTRARLRIRADLMTNTLDELELYAKVLPGTETFEAVRYRWDLGDGTTKVTDVPMLRHDFARAKRDDQLETSFLVTCTAIAKDGSELTGRRSITRPSNAFMNLAFTGFVILERTMSPRFPVLDDHGNVTQKVTLWHSYEKPVRITQVLRVEHPAHRGEPKEVVVEPTSLLPTTVLRRRQPITFEVRLESDVPKDVAFVEYQIEGVTEDGRPASGRVSVLRPPPRPGSGKGRPVIDAMLAARIVRAQQLLQRKMVSAEDLRRLEREGAFAGLKPLANFTPPKAPAQPAFPPR